MSRPLDCLFVNPNSAAKVYQGLAKDFSAKEVPVWSLLLAQSCRAKGYGVGIMDCDAMQLTDEQAAKFIGDIKPRVVCLVVYGQNPNSGTTNMTGAQSLAAAIKSAYGKKYKVCVVGSHASALPEEVLKLNGVDYVLLNEGVYALHNLLASKLTNDAEGIKGLGWHKDHGAVIETKINSPERTVPQELMDVDLPGYAWDLLPYNKKPFDLYRSHNWHANFNDELRTPAAALYTSLGCRFKCDFCMINILNRTTGKVASDSAFMRFWSPELILNEYKKLVEDYGVTTIRISDEMFFLDKRYYEPLLNGLVERGYGKKLHQWAYARVDTVRENFLELFKKAGIQWLALGIETGNQQVRKEVTKGTYQDVNIRHIVKSISHAGIHVIANYLYGLPDDNFITMGETLRLALELNTEMYNAYTCMALPGSPLYRTAVENKWELPQSFDGYSFHSYECMPLRTKYLTAAEVLRFRDAAWQKYFCRPEYHKLVKEKFGYKALNHVINMTKVPLRRKLLEQ